MIYSNIGELKGLFKVFFSKPMYIKGKMKGILRYSKDYTELFKNGESLTLNIKLLMIIVFALNIGKYYDFGVFCISVKSLNVI